MKKVILFLTSVFLFVSSVVFAQTEAPLPTTFVYRDFTISTTPNDAQIFRISANGSEEKLGVGTLLMHLDKDETNTIEVRRDGYIPVRRLYQRQKGAPEVDNVTLTTRILQINAYPPNAHIFVNGNDLGTSPQSVNIKPGEKISVEVKKPGFVAQNKVYYNQPGQESPPVSDNIKLDDRIILLTASPKTANILVDGKKIATGNTSIIIHKDECAKVSIEQGGYIPETKTYCNKDNEDAPPLNDEIALKDRETEINVTPNDADIFIDGKKMTSGFLKLKIPQTECREVLVVKTGYARYKTMICNQQDKTAPDLSYHIALDVDEAVKESDATSSGYANQKFEVPVKKTLKPDDAWKVLLTIINSKFNEFQQLDASSCYLTTNWVASKVLNANTSFPQIIRTRVLVSLAAAPTAKTPLTYAVTIQSEISKLDKECTATSNKVPPVRSDECFTQYEYVLRSYSDLISQIQQRMMQK